MGQADTPLGPFPLGLDLPRDTIAYFLITIIINPHHQRQSPQLDRIVHFCDIYPFYY